MSTPRFAHVVLQTSRKAQMREWYCALLGAHVVFENDLLTFLTFDDEHHRIALLSPPVQLDPRSPKAAGLNHSAYTFGSLEELLERYAALKRNGIEPAVPIQHGVTTSLYYRDPDGNLVELQVDNFATPEEATAYMRGPEYGADAVGVRFLPELMRSALAAGTSAKEIQTRKWALAASPALPDPLLELTR